VLVSLRFSVEGGITFVYDSGSAGDPLMMPINFTKPNILNARFLFQMLRPAA
jgi:hypothetical protein